MIEVKYSLAVKKISGLMASWLWHCAGVLSATRTKCGGTLRPSLAAISSTPGPEHGKPPHTSDPQLLVAAFFLETTI